jgi:NADH-quinone oxidoreductase subunit C
MTYIDTTIATLREKHPHAIEQVLSFRGETTLVVAAAALLHICQLLRNDPALYYSFLVDLAAVDYHPQQPRFGVSYLLHARKNNARLRLRVLLPGHKPRLASVSAVWPAAEWPEREAFDLMGIEFTGHPDLRRILMPADWEGHPLRKDYALGYEEVQFSFNWREIDRRKDYAQE